MIDPQGRYYGRSPDLEHCKAAADRLGAGAKVEGLDQFLNSTGDIIYEVKN